MKKFINSIDINMTILEQIRKLSFVLVLISFSVDHFVISRFEPNFLISTNIVLTALVGTAVFFTTLNLLLFLLIKMRIVEKYFFIFLHYSG